MLRNESALKVLTTLIICPLLEEATFTILSQHLYFHLMGGKTLLGFEYYTISALIFSATHIHMVKDKVFGALVSHQGTTPDRFYDAFGTCFKVMLLPFIFKFYSAWTLDKTGNFYPCAFLHAYCNFMGGPLMKRNEDVVIHILAIAGFFGAVQYVFYGDF